MPTDPGVCCDGVWYATGTPGICCGGVWRTEEGDCCLDVWYPAADPCPEGGTYQEFGDGCCGCIPDTIEITPGEGQVPTPYEDLCCPTCGSPHVPYVGEEKTFIGCLGRCCVDGVCTTARISECEGTWYEGCCTLGCPVPCCFEDTDGVSQCETRNASACEAPDLVVESCATDCLGECCIDGVSQGQTTQADCDTLGGQWAGLGSTSCQPANECRSPFTSACCESKESSGYGLTFTQPRRKRTPPFSDTLRVTVTGTTDSQILIHGTSFGVNADPPKRCVINHTFLLCWDEFNVEPVPCNSRFQYVDLTVCWEQEDTQTETLNFSGCDSLTLNLGYCPYSCVTTMTYSGAGHTSDSAVVLRGDAVIEANGTGPLVLTTPITVAQSCVSADPTLTLAGSSTQSNEVFVIDDASADLDVIKDGPGTWLLSDDSTYSGQLKLLGGTLVVTVDVASSGASPFGTGTAVASLPQIGSNSSAVYFLFGNVTVSRGFTVLASLGEVTIGATSAGTAIFSIGTGIRLGRSVILQAASGGTAIFANDWLDSGGGTSPAVAMTVGSAGNDGTVIFESDIPNSITGLSVVAGTLKQDSNERIYSGTPFTIGSATYDLDGLTQSLESLSFSGGAASIIDGTLKLGSYPTPSGTASVNASGTGHTISADVSLEVPVTFAGSGSLTVSGVISGSSVTKNGSGTVIFSGANTYTGGTTINGGILQAGSVGAFGTGDITVNAGGTLDKNGFAISNTIINNGGTVLN